MPGRRLTFKTCWLDLSKFTTQNYVFARTFDRKTHSPLILNNIFSFWWLKTTDFFASNKLNTLLFEIKSIESFQIISPFQTIAYRRSCFFFFFSCCWVRIWHSKDRNTSAKHWINLLLKKNVSMLEFLNLFSFIWNKIWWFCSLIFSRLTLISEIHRIASEQFRRNCVFFFW